VARNGHCRSHAPERCRRVAGSTVQSTVRGWYPRARRSTEVSARIVDACDHVLYDPAESVPPSGRATVFGTTRCASSRPTVQAFSHDSPAPFEYCAVEPAIRTSGTPRRARSRSIRRCRPLFLLSSPTMTIRSAVQTRLRIADDPSGRPDGREVGRRIASKHAIGVTTALSARYRRAPHGQAVSERDLSCCPAPRKATGTPWPSSGSKCQCARNAPRLGPRRSRLGGRSQPFLAENEQCGTLSTTIAHLGPAKARCMETTALGQSLMCLTVTQRSS